MKQYRPKPEPRSASFEESPQTFERDLKAALQFSGDGKYGKDCESLPPDKRRRLTALSHYYGYTHNGYVLLEALKLCEGVNPPVWVLVSLTKCIDDFQNGKSLERSLALGKRHRQEYEQFRSDWPVMSQIEKQCQKGKSIADACQSVRDAPTNKYPHGRTPSALEKQYRKFWKGFFEYVEGK